MIYADNQSSYISSSSRAFSSRSATYSSASESESLSFSLSSSSSGGNLPQSQVILTRFKSINLKRNSEIQSSVIPVSQSSKTINFYPTQERARVRSSKRSSDEISSTTNLVGSVNSPRRCDSISSRRPLRFNDLQSKSDVYYEGGSNSDDEDFVGFSDSYSYSTSRDGSSSSATNVPVIYSSTRRARNDPGFDYDKIEKLSSVALHSGIKHQKKWKFSLFLY